MKSTREKILHTLLTKQQATINELAQIVGINGISVRHHLINLQAEGLINAEEQRHGVGRPRFVYRLTQRGLEKFPTNYLRFTELLIAKLQEVLSPQQLNKVFEGVGIQQAADIKEEVEGDTLDKRLTMSIQLSNLGYRLDSRRWPGPLIMNHNCPTTNRRCPPQDLQGGRNHVRGLARRTGETRTLHRHRRSPLCLPRER